MLPPNACVYVCAPSSPFDAARLQAATETLRSWGYTVEKSPHLHARTGHTAGTADQRLADLAHGLSAPGFDAVWFARGGFGLSHLLPDLPWDAIAGDRPVMGFSDATGLLNACADRQLRGLRAPLPIHGPVLQNLAPFDLRASANAVVTADAETRSAVRALLETGRALPWSLEPLTSGVDPVTGPVVGGNLAVLASLCGTPFALRAESRVVVLEEVGEAPYRVDRLWTQLVQAGSFDGVLAVVLGEFLDCKSPDGDPYAVRSLLAARAGALGVPVWCGAPVGHGSRNLPWIVGATATVADGRLVWQQRLV
jgi:muramoyltetrapeptide carboxypeptidase